MNEVTFVKCSCEHCGNRIEYPESGVGRILNCPHCGQPTRLTRGIVPPQEPESAPDTAPALAAVRRGDSPGRMIAVLSVLVIAAAAAVTVWYYKRIPSAPAAIEPVPVATGNEKTAVATNAEPAAVNREKSPDDLKISPIELEKTPGTKIVYAIGTLTNDSTYQRFGVTVELEVLSRTGRNAGVARDYKNVIEPGQTWKFRAMVTDSKAASARVSSVNEEK